MLGRAPEERKEGRQRLHSWLRQKSHVEWLA